jgi:hypothetical protein
MWKKIIVTNEIKELEHNKASWDVMKSRITDDYYRVRRMYEPTQVVRNVNNYFFCTNNYSSIKMGQKDRRYDIKEVSDKHEKDIRYFSRLRKTFTREMKSQLLRYFLDIDTSDFNHLIPPTSVLKKEMQDSQKPLAELFFEHFDWKDSVGFDRSKDGMVCKDLYTEGFIPFCDKFAIPERYRISFGGFGMAIRKYVDHTGEGKDRRYYPKPPPAPDPEAKKNNAKKRVAAKKASLKRSAPEPSPEPAASQPASPPSQSPPQPGSRLPETPESLPESGAEAGAGSG